MGLIVQIIGVFLVTCWLTDRQTERTAEAYRRYKTQIKNHLIVYNDLPKMPEYVDQETWKLAYYETTNQLYVEK